MNALIRILAIPIAILGALFGSIAGLFAALFGLSKAAIAIKKMEDGPIPCPKCAGKVDPGTGMFSKDNNCTLCDGYGMIEKCCLCETMKQLNEATVGQTICPGCNGWGFQVGTHFLGFNRKNTPSR